MKTFGKIIIGICILLVIISFFQTLALFKSKNELSNEVKSINKAEVVQIKQADISGLNKQFSEFKETGTVISWSISNDKETLSVTMTDFLWDNISLKKKAEITIGFLDIFAYYMKTDKVIWDRCVKLFSESGVKVSEVCSSYYDSPKVFY